MGAEGWKPDSVRTLFDQLMAVNPAVEVYLLGNDGRIEADAAPAGHVKLDRVDLEPVRRFLAGDALPILGADPRNTGARKVFSAAPIRIDGQRSEEHTSELQSLMRISYAVICLQKKTMR